MAQNSSRAAGRHFLQIPGPTPVPDRVLRAMDTPMIDHRGPEFAKLAKKCLDGIKTIFKTTNPVIIYTATGTGAWEARAGQHAVARRPRADGGDRPVRHAVEEDGRAARPQARIHRDRLAHRRRSRARSKRSCARTRTRRSRRSASCTTRPRPAALVADRRDPQGDRRRRPSGAVHGRHHLLARLDRLPPRRMGRRRLGRRRAEGPDAAARHVVQRHQRQGARGQQDLQAAEVVLRLGRHAQHEQGRLLPLHAGDADAAAASSTASRCCTRKASTTCSRATTGWPKPRAARCKAWGLEILCRERRTSIRRPSPRC